MNTQHRDILTAIGRKQPITTSALAEYLMDHFGYGGGMEFDAFRDQVSKTIGYLKNKGEIVGEDIPQSKGKPLRYWSLAELQLEEMASDVAEIKATVHESLTVETATPEPVSVEVKVAHKPPMSVQEVVDNYPINFLEPHMFFAYCAGISKAEKHHGIGQ